MFELSQWKQCNLIKNNESFHYEYKFIGIYEEMFGPWKYEGYRIERKER